MSLQTNDITSTIKGLSDYDNHPSVIYGRDLDCGYEGYIAIHNINRGPALGGIRLLEYETKTDAIIDVLRLSRGMSYKAALAGLPLGGGKSVILENAKTITHREAQFRAHGRFIDLQCGNYIGGEDVGVDLDDALVIREETSYVVGIKSKETATGSILDGDPSPYTAAGVRSAILAAVKYRYGWNTLKGVQISIKGCGHVGSNLVKLLHNDGAILFVADEIFDRSVKMNTLYGAKVLDKDSIHAHPVHVFAPCALGNEINEETISELQCDIVCGAANNVLQGHSFGDKLLARKISYGVDYVVNAGGLMVVATELNPVFDGDALRAQINGIGDTMTEIFRRSDVEQKSTNDVSQAIAMERIWGKH